MDNGTFSPADYAAMTHHDHHDDGFGNGGTWMWILCIFILFFMFGGFSGNAGGNPQQIMTDAVIAGQGGYVTNSQMNDAIQFNSLQNGDKDIISAVNQSKYDTTNTLSAIENRIAGQESNILSLGNTIAEKQNTCCQEMLRGIDGLGAQTTQGLAQLGYQASQDTASINAKTTEMGQKVLDALSQNKIESLQNQVSALQLQNAMAGVLRYPNQWTYNAGTSPFCSCGNGCGFNCGNI